MILLVEHKRKAPRKKRRAFSLFYPIGKGLLFILAFGNRIALTDDFVIIEATDTSALPTHSQSSWGPHTNYSLSQFVDNMRR